MSVADLVAVRAVAKVAASAVDLVVELGQP